MLILEIGAPTTSPSTRPATVAPLLMLTIEECRRAALANNLDLQVELYNPTIAHTLVTQEQAAYETTFNGAMNYIQSQSPPAGTVSGFTQYNVVPDANLQIPLQTGGSFKFDAPFQFIKDSGIPSSLNPSYTFTPNLTFSQPLLRGFGFDVNCAGHSHCVLPVSTISGAHQAGSDSRAG